MSQERISVAVLLKVGLQRRLEFAESHGPISRPELRRAVVANPAKEEQKAIKHIESHPKQMREALGFIQETWQETHPHPLARPYLAAQVVLESNLRPSLEESFAYRTLGKEIEAALEFDRAFGMGQAISPLVNPEDAKGEAAEHYINKTANQWAKHLPSFRIPLHEQDQIAKAVGDNTQAMFELLKTDRTGFAVVDTHITRLETLFGNGEKPPAGNLRLMSRVIVLQGAHTAGRLYKAIYPLTEGLAPEFK